ncbi:MAG: M16 family metallopeptidase [Pseudobacter sp.]|uniref:M16 family metallopeptidase n=1 Tax=Pseudobacter sp. TaxID=2045420 RepID=UPI003F7E39E2
MMVTEFIRKAGISAAVLSAFTGCQQQGDNQNAKKEWKETTSNGFHYKYVDGDPMKSRFYTLKNGLTVILSPNNREPRIRSLMALRAGSNNDPETHTGLAHYLEHLLFKGTNKFGTLDSTQEKSYIDEITRLYEVYNQTTDARERKTVYHQIDSVSGIAAKYAIANEYDQIMAAMGGIGTNAHTSFDETVYEENFPSNAIDKYLMLQAERFNNPVFRLFHTELEAVYEEKNRSLDSDNSNMFDSLLAGLFPNHNYGKQTILGTTAHLKNPSLKAIRNFYNTYYVPSNMGLIMAGDFDPDTLIAKIEKSFSAWPAGKTPAEYKAPDEPAFTQPVSKTVIGPDAENITIAFRLPGAKNYEGTIESTIIQNLLYNGKAGLMDLNLNNQQKVLGSVAWFMPMKDYSVLVLSGNPGEGQSLDQVKDLLLSQVNLIKQGQFNDSLLKAISVNYKLSKIQSIHSNDNRANMLMGEFIRNKGVNWDKEVGFVNNMEQVSKTQLMEFAKKFLDQNYVVVYKKAGVNSNQEKVEKPGITPVTINRDVQSALAKQIATLPAGAIQPQWIDYNKDLNRSMAGSSPLLHVLNKEDQLFRLSFRIDLGEWHNRLLPIAVQYLDFLGDSTSSSDEIKRQFYNIACDYNIATANEHTTILITGLHENFANATTAFEKLLRTCREDRAALDNLKARILKGRQDAKLNKEAIGEALRNYAMFGAQNPFNYQLSNKEIQELTADQLINVLHNLFNYAHTIVYYGPMKEKDFKEQISSLHAVPASWSAAPPAMQFTRTQPSGKEILFAPYNMVQAEVQWVNNSIPFDSTLMPTTELFNQYFGGGMGSVVFQTIREARAQAYTAYAVYRTPAKKADNYSTMAYVGTQADKMKEAILAMDELLTNLPQSPAMLEIAREAILQKIANERIMEDAIAFNFLYAQKFGLHTDQRKYIYEKVKTITFEEVNKFYTDHIAGKNYTYCILGSDATYKQSAFLQPAVSRKLTPDQLFGY